MLALRMMVAMIASMIFFRYEYLPSRQKCPYSGIHMPFDVIKTSLNHDSHVVSYEVAVVHKCFTKLRQSRFSIWLTVWQLCSVDQKRVHALPASEYLTRSAVNASTKCSGVKKVVVAVHVILVVEHVARKYVLVCSLYLVCHCKFEV